MLALRLIVVLGFVYSDVVAVVMVVGLFTLVVVLGLLYSNVVVVIAVVAVTELTISINISCCTGFVDLDVVVC